MVCAKISTKVNMKNESNNYFFGKGKKQIISFSGGKDSTAMLFKMIELNYKIDDIVFVDTGLELPEMYEYIKKVEIYIDRKITILKSEHSWDWHFYKIKKKGNRKGQIYGYPYTIGAWCTDRLKLVPLNNYFKKQGKHIRYIGIAKDEQKRKDRLKNNEIAFLYEIGMTEKDAYNYLISLNMLNPLYLKFNRLGCYNCIKQPLKSLKVIYEDYPKLWNKMKLQEIDSPSSFKPNKSLIDIENKFKKQDTQYKCF
jgi:3'-phosphoadenosine 5'-phosphosulfate sulfotransferase (PAPS reductase)/FAD synthetase